MISPLHVAFRIYSARDVAYGRPLKVTQKQHEAIERLGQICPEARANLERYIYELNLKLRMEAVPPKKWSARHWMAGGALLLSGVSLCMAIIESLK